MTGVEGYGPAQVGTVFLLLKSLKENNFSAFSIFNSIFFSFFIQARLKFIYGARYRGRNYQISFLDDYDKSSSPASPIKEFYVALIKKTKGDEIKGPGPQPKPIISLSPFSPKQYNSWRWKDT